MKALRCTAFVLVIVGGLNWGLIAIGNWMGSNWNIVNLILGMWPTIENLVYLLVGISAIVLIFKRHCNCASCSVKQPQQTGGMM